ncbi:MAG: nuclear transport factor 2 family protein [Gammaproteobacteria bacterium]
MTGKNSLRNVLGSGVALLLALSSSAATAAQAAPAAPQLLKLEQAWIRALTEHDSVFLNRLLADNFIDVSWKGRLRNKTDMLEDLKKSKPTTQILSDLKVRTFSDTAIVTGLNTITGKDTARIAQLRFTDVFVRQAGDWHAVSSQETLVSRP